MTSPVLVGLQGFAAFLLFVAIFIIFTSFRNFYGGLGKTILVSFTLFFIYNLIEIYILTRDDITYASQVSRVSSIVLATAYYLLHLFHDEISASYRQRKTMTLASVIYGMVVGAAFFDNALNIDPVTGAPFVHPYYGMLIVTQAAFAVHRITEHIILMSQLSDHYGIKSNISTKTRFMVQRVLLGSLIIGIFMMLFIEDILSLPFAIITALGMLVLAILYKVDPISSIPIAQQMKAVALIDETKMRYYHLFSDDVKGFVDKEDFGDLVNNISKLYVDIVQSKSYMESLSTGEYVFLFESCGSNEYLLLILENKAPFVRTILESLARIIITSEISNQVQFAAVVEKHLIYPNN